MLDSIKKTDQNVHHPLSRFKYMDNFSLETKLAIAWLVSQEQLFLEIGAGNKKGDNGWVTLDACEGADL